MKELNEQIDGEQVFLTLHTLDGKPLVLRRDFIISVLGPVEGGEPRPTVVAVDEGNKTGKYEIREHVNAISGPFAKLSNLKLNPAYFVGVVPSTNGNADYPNSIRMRTPDGHSFITGSSPEHVVGKIQKALQEGPC